MHCMHPHTHLKCPLLPARAPPRPPQNLGRKNATTAALNCASLLWMNPLAGQCTSLTGALVVPNALPFWVLEAGPAKDKYYIRSAACAAGTPSYLGMAKQDCARTQPMLFNRTNPWGDLVWTLELASAGMPRILNITQTGAAGKFNVVTVLVRAAPGPSECWFCMGQAAPACGARRTGKAGAGGRHHRHALLPSCAPSTAPPCLWCRREPVPAGGHARHARRAAAAAPGPRPARRRARPGQVCV